MLLKIEGYIIENIDVMKYEGVYFYRKAGVKQPHNGFTDFRMLTEASGKLNYGNEDNFVGYPHKENIKSSKSLDHSTHKQIRFLRLA